MVPGLRSPHAFVGGLIYVGRMFDKIRLRARGDLPADYEAALGKGLDRRACDFLRVDYANISARVLAGGTDEQALAWALATGGGRSAHDCTVWNAFLRKLAWRDDRSAFLRDRVVEQGFADQGIETFFDLIERDEGRPHGIAGSASLRPLVLVVMGVCGTGKSTIGHQLADTLGCAFADADDFHPPANVARMRSGIPLEDADREPWLDALRDHLAQSLAAGRGIVLACSALKARYRERLRPDGISPRLVYLHGARELLTSRLQARQNHYMPPTLLESQLSTLEPPSHTEAVWCDVAAAPEAVVGQILSVLSPHHPAAPLPA